MGCGALSDAPMHTDSLFVLLPLERPSSGDGVLSSVWRSRKSTKTRMMFTKKISLPTRFTKRNVFHSDLPSRTITPPPKKPTSMSQVSPDDMKLTGVGSSSA
eukprot:scaffold40834_cov31-Tisochrysis_lutea.AAC.2